MRNILKNDKGSVQMIGAAVGILVTIIIAVLVFYNIAASIDTTSIDSHFGGANETPAANATDDTLAQASTFFSIAPIIVIVLVAVIILGYVTRIG